jgi:hypothetical protein
MLHIIEGFVSLQQFPLPQPALFCEKSRLLLSHRALTLHCTMLRHQRSRKALIMFTLNAEGINVDYATL